MEDAGGMASVDPAMLGPVREHGTHNPAPTLVQPLAQTQARANVHLAMVELERDGGADIWQVRRLLAGSRAGLADAQAQHDDEILSALDRAMLAAAGRNDAEVLQLLHSAGGRVETQDDAGWTPLRMASRLGHASAVRELLRVGADHAARGANGASALHLACISTNADAVRFLLAAGASPNVREEQGLAPLHLAVGSGNKEVVVALLSAGAHREAKDHRGRTPIDYAAELCMRPSAEGGCSAAVRAVARHAPRMPALPR